MDKIGAYKIIKQLRKTQHGAVYSAQHESTGKQVAIKTIFTEGLGDIDAAKAVREFDIARSIEHEFLSRSVELISSDSSIAIVIEWFSETDLAAIIGERSTLDPAIALLVLKRVTQGLGCLHDKKIIHRDIKPSNILCDPVTWKVQIIDFGISVLQDQNQDQSGSLFYMGASENLCLT